MAPRQSNTSIFSFVPTPGRCRIEKGGTTGQIPRIGDIVSHYAPLFHIYAEYAKLHQRASEKLFSSLTADLCSKYGLSDRTMNAQMILPIQRVPRYELLLKEIVKKIGGDKKADLEEKVREWKGRERGAGTQNIPLSNISFTSIIIFHNTLRPRSRRPLLASRTPTHS